SLGVVAALAGLLFGGLVGALISALAALVAFCGSLERAALVLAARFGRLVFRRRENLDRAAGLLDRGDGRLRRPPDREIDLGLKLAIAKQLDATLLAANDA